MGDKKMAKVFGADRIRAFGIGKFLSLKHGDQNLYKNDFSYFTNKTIIDKRQFWIHCKSKTVYYMYTTTNWPPKRSMMYAILFKQKEIETILKFPYLCQFFLILIDACYF